jgi:hypothetical protein
VNAASPRHRGPGFAGIFHDRDRSPFTISGAAGSRSPATGRFTLHDLVGAAGVHDPRHSWFTPTFTPGATGVHDHDHQKPRSGTWRRRETLVQASCAEAAPNATRPLDVSVEGPRSSPKQGVFTGKPLYWRPSAQFNGVTPETRVMARSTVSRAMR